MLLKNAEPRQVRTTHTALHGWQARDSFSRNNRSAIEQLLEDHLRIGPINCRWIESSDDDFALDQRLGIDLQITAVHRGTLTAQVKTLSTDYRTITVEITEGDGSPGDMDTCTAMLYVVAYVDSDGAVTRWAILDWSRLLLAGMRNLICWRRSMNADGIARATFVDCPFSEVLSTAPECVIAWGGDW